MAMEGTLTIEQHEVLIDSALTISPFLGRNLYFGFMTLDSVCMKSARKHSSVADRRTRKYDNLTHMKATLLPRTRLD